MERRKLKEEGRHKVKYYLHVLVLVRRTTCPFTSYPKRANTKQDDEARLGRIFRVMFHLDHQIFAFYNPISTDT